MNLRMGYGIIGLRTLTILLGKRMEMYGYFLSALGRYAEFP